MLSTIKLPWGACGRMGVHRRRSAACPRRRSARVSSGGSTVYDTADAGLARGIKAEWTRTDAAYAERVAHLRYGAGLNSVLLLNASKVIDDGDATANKDLLTGGTDQDWFFARASECFDRLSSEFLY